MEHLRQNVGVSIDIKHLERLLLVLAATLLVLVIALALLLVAHQPQRRAEVTQPRVAQVENRPLTRNIAPATAVITYEEALRVAQKWAPDAQLWRAQATWPAGADFQATAPGWVYTFYSAAQKQTALVSAAAGVVSLAQTQQPAPTRPSLVPLDRWQVDSPDAVELLLQSGGRAFLSVHKEASMILTLTADGQLRWRATLIDESEQQSGEGKQVFRIEFDAASGNLITTSLP